ncbi:MAG: threonine--tRNA ligase [Candidatus Cloacimonetes bacterium]|nr:threonine--tRNA ligase [Candidatus Cloacimonadota bacterium]
MKIDITLPDGSVRSYSEPISAFDIAKGISPRLADAALCVESSGMLHDMSHVSESDANVLFHTFKTESGKELYWHSTSHLMAQAVKQLFPDVKVTIGPAIEQGFYYDFDRDEPFTDEDLAAIETRMAELIKADEPYYRKELSKAEAIEKFKALGEDYKLEILAGIPDTDTISTYQQGDFVDLCRGPHLPSTGKIKAFKLLKTSGAYWHGDEKNKMLKRIYGISFPSNKELAEYLTFLEEAKKRDHRKLGKDLDLFSMNDEVGPGLVLWHPNGAMIRHLIESFWKEEHFRRGYQLVYTPHIGRAQLWKTSGHLDFYTDSMYAPMVVDEQDYYIKPMNCPFHIHVYKANHRSYRELPIRLAELGTVYRYERSGVLHGLMRVRGFTQDDAHIICTPEQLDVEVEKLLQFSLDWMKSFGFKDIIIYLSTMPEKKVGDEADWERATQSLRLAIEKFGLEYRVDEGGGAFYGPKIDVKIKDAIGREWQCTTIQFDFNLSTRFDMSYIGADNTSHRPFMIHRAIMGSMERFFATLLEYHSGNLPLWLCPVQIMLLPITDAQLDYAAALKDKLLAEGIRAEVDTRSEKIGYKIRDAEMRKVPYMAILGKKEEAEQSLSLRRHTQGDLGALSVEDAVSKIRAESQPG